MLRTESKRVRTKLRTGERALKRGKTPGRGEKKSTERLAFIGGVLEPPITFHGQGKDEGKNCGARVEEASRRGTGQKDISYKSHYSCSA